MIWLNLKKLGGQNWARLPGGVGEQSKKLKAEGHEIEKDKAGNLKRVKDWEKKLVVI